MKTNLLMSVVAVAMCAFGSSAWAGDVDMAKALDGDLVVLKGKDLEPYPGKVSDIKLYAIYSSASWCGPCRAFTPDLVKFYNRAKPKHPDFEVIFRSGDKSEEQMIDYMKEDKMKWPALKYGSRSPVNKFSGNGIPCLVVVDDKGAVLAHTYVNGQYVGPQKVLEDLEDLLKKKSTSSSKSSSDSFFSK